MGVVTPVTVNGQTMKMATAIDVIRVRNRVIFAYLYSEYKDESTVGWLRIASEQWADAILKANP